MPHITKLTARLELSDGTLAEVEFTVERTRIITMAGKRDVLNEVVAALEESLEHDGLIGPQG